MLNKVVTIDLKKLLKGKLIESTHHITGRGADLPEIGNWKWDATHAGKSG